MYSLNTMSSSSYSVLCTKLTVVKKEYTYRKNENKEMNEKDAMLLRSVKRKREIKI